MSRKNSFTKDTRDKAESVSDTYLFVTREACTESDKAEVPDASALQIRRTAPELSSRTGLSQKQNRQYLFSTPDRPAELSDGTDLFGEPDLFGQADLFGEAATNPTGLLRRECVAFSGYRAHKFAGRYPAGDAEQHIKALLGPVILREYAQGVRYFYTGMASGFDLWAADEVLRLRDEGECPEVHTVAVLPHAGQINAMRTPRERYLFERIIRQSTLNIILSDHYYKHCHLRRNDYMIASVSKIICCYDGKPGGTRYTISHARKKGLTIINLFAS